MSEPEPLTMTRAARGRIGANAAASAFFAAVTLLMDAWAYGRLTSGGNVPASPAVLALHRSLDPSASLAILTLASALTAATHAALWFGGTRWLRAWVRAMRPRLAFNGTRLQPVGERRLTIVSYALSVVSLATAFACVVAVRGMTTSP